MKRFECKNCEHFRCVVFGTEVLSNKSFECKEKIFKTKWYEIAEEEEKAEVKAEELPSWCKVGEVVYHKESNKFFKIATFNEEAKLIELEDNGWFYLDELAEARLRPFNNDEMRELVGKTIASKYTEASFLIISSISNYVNIAGDMYSCEDFLKYFTFTNGQPCGVYEHFENGEWVK